MDKILHYLKDPKLWELWYIPYYGSSRILSINRMLGFAYYNHSTLSEPEKKQDVLGGSGNLVANHGQLGSYNSTYHL